MADTPFIARGFHRRRPEAPPGRLPPGQYETRDFPVLSAGPTPHTALDRWTFTVEDTGGHALRWNWDEFQALPHATATVDIHCVTKWSKFDTRWEGISVDTLLRAAYDAGVVSAPYIVAYSDGGYATNLPLDDVTGGKAWIAFNYGGAP